MYTQTRQQSNFKLMSMEKLMDCFYLTTKQARTDAAWGTVSEALNRCTMLETFLYFTLVFIL